MTDADGADLPILRDHIRDTARWLIGDAAGDRLTVEQAGALADEIAIVLASGLAPVIRREVEHQTEKTIAALQKGPVSFTYDHELSIDGFTVPDVVKLLDAAGRLVDVGSDSATGIGTDVHQAISGLHETHRHMLYRAHDAWCAKNNPPGDA